MEALVYGSLVASKKEDLFYGTLIDQGQTNIFYYATAALIVGAIVLSYLLRNHKKLFEALLEINAFQQ